jgi:excisionase family DNA binding protein
MEKQLPEREFETVKELAQRTGKTYRTIHRHIQAGKIKTVRFGGSVMVPKREVERILAHGF